MMLLLHLLQKLGIIDSTLPLYSLECKQNCSPNLKFVILMLSHIGIDCYRKISINSQNVTNNLVFHRNNNNPNLKYGDNCNLKESLILKK